MVFVYDDLFDVNSIEKCVDWLDKANWTYGWPSNAKMIYGHWNVDIAKGNRHNTTDVSSNLPDEFANIWEQLKNKIFDDTTVLVRCYSNRHTFGTEGYIHTDTEMNNSATCVIYLDKEWKPNWGGETTFYTQDNTEIIKAVLPKFARAVIFPGNINHCARSITRICPNVRTTLMFKVITNPQDLQQVVDKLSKFLDEVGANQINHKRGTLKDHLLRVFYLLKGAGFDDVIALSGGLHSVYGTNVFTKVCLPFENSSVLNVFGPDVDRIVRLFGSINRPSVLENPDGTVDESDLFALRCIECANLYDQNEFNPQKYPNLYAFALQVQERMNHGY
jgi:hypothetical protein